MKTPVRSTGWRILFVLATLGASYLVGLSQRVVQEEVAAAENKSGDGKQETASNPVPTRDQALQKLLSDIQHSGTNRGDSPFIRGIVSDSPLYRLDKNIRPTDLPFLIEHISNLPPDDEQGQVLSALIYALRKTDPDAAIVWAGKITNEWDQTKRIGQALAEICKKDPRRALAELDKLSAAKHQGSLYSAVFSAWATDPTKTKEAVAAALALPAGDSRTGALSAIAYKWGDNFGNHAKDADRSPIKDALAWAGNLPPEDADVLLSVMRFARELAPADAALYVDRLPDAKKRNDTIVEIALNWGQFRYENDPTNKRYSTKNLLAADSATNPAPAILDWLNEVATGATYDTAVARLFSNLNPQVALTMLDKVTEPDVREKATQDMLTRWGNTDPHAALAWIQQNLPEAEKTSRIEALKIVVEQWAGQKPEEALAYLQSSPDPALVELLAPKIAQQLAYRDADAALAYLQSLPPGKSKDDALTDIIQAKMHQKGFDAAWDQLAGIPPDASRDAAMGKLIAGMADRNPAKAAQLAAQFSTESAQTDAVDKIAANWIRQDPKAFTEWVTTLPPGGARDVATTQLVTTQLATNPEQALTWAQSISDPKSRETQIQITQLASQATSLPRGAERDAALAQLISTQAPSNPAEAKLWANLIADPKIRAEQQAKLKK